MPKLIIAAAAGILLLGLGAALFISRATESRPAGEPGATATGPQREASTPAPVQAHAAPPPPVQGSAPTPPPPGHSTAPAPPQGPLGRREGMSTEDAVEVRSARIRGLIERRNAAARRQPPTGAPAGQ